MEQPVHRAERGSRRALVLALVSAVIVIGAVLLAALVGPRAQPEPPAGSDAARTLDSLRLVDDYPLYVMTYAGDYGFDAYLEGLSAGAPHPDRVARAIEGAGCSTFVARSPQGDVIMGRNFDWVHHAALLLFTDPPGGYASASMVDMGDMGFENGVTPSANRSGLLDAPFIPIDGLNEAGLAVSIMAVPSAEQAAEPARPTLISVEITRLLLDHAASVDEALALMGGYAIDWGGGPELHYLLADTSGRSVVVEFVGGEMVAVESDDPWQIATNFVLHGADPAQRPRLCGRYAVMQQALETAGGQLADDEAMSLLASVAQEGSAAPTMWSVLYNLSSGEISVVVGRRYEAVHTFTLAPAGD
jgi:hypothetical protein